LDKIPLQHIPGFKIVMKKILLLLGIVTSLSFNLFAQNGNIRGTVFEDATGEPLIGVTVLVKGTTKGAITDLDGKFDISIEPGTYSLQISFISYKVVTISEVVVKSTEVTLINMIALKEDVEELEAVVITAEAVRDSEASLMKVKQKSASVMDGISAANFRKMGDSDAASAIKRVTGVSVEGGKYVYVRGLGDRYTKTMLNGVDIPGLDPDRNSLQIDIFPTNLINNMMVMKSSVAEMPADFTGGVVNIETKDFPDEKIFTISASIAYNPRMHFNNEFITYDGSSTDFLGFDNGQRALPLGADNGPDIPTPLDPKYSDQEINQFLKGFNPKLGAKTQTSFMDYSLGLSLGNQFTLKNDNKLGYIMSLTYKSDTRFYDDQFYGEYQRPSGSENFELVPAVLQSGVLSESNVLIGGLAGLAFKTQFSKYKLTFMHLQNGERRAGQFYIIDDPTNSAVGKSGYEATSDNLDYSQRGLTNILLSGDHLTETSGWKVNWRLSSTFSKITDPDVRKTAFSFTTSDTLFVAGAAGNPNRIWRFLDEINLVGKVDLTKEHMAFGNPAKLKFGVSHVYKERDYKILFYDMQFFGPQPEFGYDPNNVLKDENLWPNGTLYYSSGNADPNPRQYNSNVHNTGLYVSSEVSPLTDLKLILGLRAEKFVQRHTGRDQQQTNVLENDKVLDALDLFPSVNAIYALGDLQNLRMSYSRTIARPSFKELSFAQILDPISNRQFNGGLFQYNGWDGNLKETRIDNFDLRWEKFLNRGQLFSVSGFYKSFDAPIEMVRIPEQQTITEIQPRNVGRGQVFGGEIEFRKALDFIAPSLQNFSVSSNVTVVKSVLTMSDLEFGARKNFEKDGETVTNTRDMAGQAPFIINAGLSYGTVDTGWELGVFYNVQGRTLIIVGTGLYSDIYAVPFHSLNFNLNKSFGPNKRSSFSIKITNLLNDKREEVYSSFKAQDQFFTSFSPGIAADIGIKYAF
jgi:TonB-dependent receptor